ncbi:diguanylate cyclase domain-containing protein [Aquipseudomonas alcaligenes]|uniref:sensor domain-containing diguanylate cyclase n=1 Tax=Aquipseudomonas alcaligenes TaxID=43263 RepID=UPI0037490A95
MRPLILLFCLLTTLACSAKPLPLADDRPVVRPAPWLEYLLTEQEMDFPEAAHAEGWRTLGGRSLSLGYQAHPVWVRLALHNTSTRNDWRLLVEWPILDRVELRLYDPVADHWGPLLQAGDHLRLSAWAEPGRQPLFPLQIEPGEQRWVYLRLHSKEAVVAPMQVLSAEAYQAQEMDQRLLLGLFFGAMLAVLLYNSSLYLFTRHPSYLWYSLYLLGVVVYELSLSGFGVLFLWPELGRPAGLIYAGSALWSFLAATMFARVFLRIPRYGGWVLWANNLLLGYWLLAIALLFLHPQWLVHLGTPAVALFSCVLALVTALSLWRRGNPSAPLFALAWALLIVCTAVHVAALQGALPVNQFTLRSQTFGFFVEFILLSIALADRINRERAARIRAQDALLTERELSLAAQRGVNEELDRRVQERTRELEQARHELERANGELTRLSYTDALTRLPNRRQVDEQLPLLGSDELAVLMLDIDHFKRINDSYGHPFGDRCIAAVGEVLRQQVRRSGDLAARYGGEEFIVLLRGCARGAAERIAESIRAAVEALRLEHQGAPVALTVSVGLAHGAAGGYAVDPLVAEADAALYAAKQAGRNRVGGAH